MTSLGISSGCVTRVVLVPYVANDSALGGSQTGRVFSMTSVFSSCTLKRNLALPALARDRPGQLFGFAGRYRHALHRHACIHQLDAFNRQRDLGSARPRQLVINHDAGQEGVVGVDEARQAGAQLHRLLVVMPAS